MGSRRIIAVLLAVLAGPAFGQQQGQVEVRQSGTPLSSSCSFLDFLSTGFTATKSGGGCRVTLSSNVSLAGSCIGDASADWCGTVDGSLGTPTWIVPTVNGSVASGGTLTLQSTTHSTRGTVDVVDQCRIATTAPSITATYNALNLLPNGLTFGSGGGLRGIFAGGTITYTANPGVAGSFFNDAVVLANPDGQARTMAPFTSFAHNVTATPDPSDNMTSLSLYGLSNNPTLTGSVGAHTATGVYGLRSAGVTDANWTVTDWAAARMLAPTDGAVSGTATITRLGFAEIDDLTAGATNYSIWSKGAAVPLCHAGGAIFGASQSTLTTPSARLHVSEATVGNEVVRFESVATNDDPNYRMFQTRTTAAASSTTNIDFSLTTVAPTTAPCAASNVCIIEARTVCHCTSGSSCTTNQGGATITTWVVKNNGGTFTQLGSSPAASGNVLGGSTGSTAIDSSLTSITSSISTTNWRTAIVVPANFGHVCHQTIIVQNVGT